MYDRDNGMDGLPFGQIFVPAPIIARNSSGMDSLPQFLLRERSDYFVVLGNVNRVLHTIMCSLVDSPALSRWRRVRLFSRSSQGCQSGGFKWPNESKVNGYRRRTSNAVEMF